MSTKMTRYRKRPVEVDAWPVPDLALAVEKYPSEVPECVADAIAEGTLMFSGGKVHIATLEGDMEGNGDSVLIRGVEGEFYPCRKDIFESTYEAVEQSP